MKQDEMELNIQPDPKIIPINGRCVLKKENNMCVVYVAGLPMHSWMSEDKMAECYAMVHLAQHGYAQQNEVAKAFGCSGRTVRRRQEKFESEGMAGLGNAKGRPPGSQSKENSRKTIAQTFKRAGLSTRNIARRLGVSKSIVSLWIRNTGKPVKENSHGDCKPVTTKLEEESIDNNPQNREHDRILARMGLIDDAPPIFTSGQRIPQAGVLLAVPVLVRSGIFSISKKIYGNIGPAFYGLRTTMLTLLLMSLLRIKRPEDLKEYSPPDLGRLLGLDRTPEVKTLRRKLTRLAAFKKAETFGKELAKKRVKQYGETLGFLYIDGHVRVYHGLHRVMKTYVTRKRLALPATIDYWVNDAKGDPVFVVTAELNANLTKMFPTLLKEIREVLGERRVTIVFDRGGWCITLFKKMIEQGFDILTYRKGKWKNLPKEQFKICEEKIEDREVSYNLNDRNIYIRYSIGKKKKRLYLRQVTRLSDDENHQTAIVTSRRDLPASEVAYRMFERWRQENFFKYLDEEFAIDALLDYEVEPEDAQALIPNPERRKINTKITAVRTKLDKFYVEYGKAVAEKKKNRRTTTRKPKTEPEKLLSDIERLKSRMKTLEEKREQIPTRIMVKDASGKQIMRLSRERKHLANCIKMAAYQAESELLALLRPHYARADQEGRTQITSAFQSAADIEVKENQLKITLKPLSSAHRSKAIAALCKQLNRMNICFPGTKLRLWFGVDM